MKIAIFGAGGIGGYFGARLAEGGADVHLIARGSHLTALRENGLRVESQLGDVDVRLPATDDVDTVGSCDVVLFCVKSTDTERAAHALAPLLSEDTAVVTLQNGVDNEDRIAAIVPASHVVGGAAYILATIAAPGVVSHQGSLARIVFGELDGKRSERLETLLALCEASGVDADLSDNIRVELWRKFAVICATAGMTAAVRLPLGEIRSSDAALTMYRDLVEEVVSVARAEAVYLPAATVPQIMETFRTLPAGWYSSLHYDMTHGKPMELDALHGTVCRLARRHHIPVPMSEAIYGILEPWALRNRVSK